MKGVRGSQDEADGQAVQLWHLVGRRKQHVREGVQVVKPAVTQKEKNLAPLMGME